MAMLEISLQPVPAQMTKVVLGGQNCQIALWQKPQGLFVDINADGVELITSVIARDAVPLICRDYMGFVGNLLFLDIQGRSDPEYTGLNDRFKLVYLNAEQYAFILE